MWKPLLTEESVASTVVLSSIMSLSEPFAESSGFLRPNPVDIAILGGIALAMSSFSRSFASFPVPFAAIGWVRATWIRFHIPILDRLQPHQQLPFLPLFLVKLEEKVLAGKI